MKIGFQIASAVTAVVCLGFGVFALGCAVEAPQEELGSTTSNIGDDNAPPMVYPRAGQVVGLSGSYMFKVQSARRSQGTLCSLWQNGVSIWENYANDGVLGQNGECAIHPNHPLHRSFKSGTAHFMARDYVDNKWTDAREIDITLSAGRPTMVYPQANQEVDFGGSYMFKMEDASNTDGALCALTQNGVRVWENYANDRTLGQNGECALHPGNWRHPYLQPGPAKFTGRFLVHNEWSEAIEININVR